MGSLALVVDAVACYRITRLVVADSITQPARDRALTFAGQFRPGFFGWFEELIGCRWCVGIWVGAGIATARWAAPGVWGPVGWAAAIAAAAPLMARLEPPKS